MERTQGGATAKVNLCGAASIAGETTCGNGRRGTFTLEHSKLGTVAHLRGRPACYPLGPGAFRAAVRRNDQETKVFGPLKLFAKRLAACDVHAPPLESTTSDNTVYASILRVVNRLFMHKV